MATRKSKTQITEQHPNPHGEQKIADAPVQTDHRGQTVENIAQNPSTADNRMKPSVTGPLEDPSTDSMFNNADLQTRELLEPKNKKENKQRTKTSNKRKAA